MQSVPATSVFVPPTDPATGDFATTPDAATVADEPREPCPTPLDWQQVLAAYRDESRPWTLSRGGRTIAGRTWGDGPSLLFLGGLVGSSDLFALTAFLLRERFRCVLFDAPLTGAPVNPADPLAVPVDDVFTVADDQADRTFDVFAASLGAAIALTAAARAPERVRGLVLQSGFAWRRLSLVERSLLAIGRRLPGRVAALPGRRTILEQNHRPWFPPFDFGRWQFFTENVGRTPIAEFAARASLIPRFDLRPLLPRIEPPVLIVRGEGEGRVAAACQDELLAGLPHARCERLHSTGHLAFLTHPHRLAKLIRTFLLDERTVAAPQGALR